MIFTSLVLFYITFLAPQATSPLNYQSVQSVQSVIMAPTSKRGLCWYHHSHYVLA